MPWRSIVALLDGDDSDRVVAQSAMTVARACDATVDGLIVRPDPREAAQLAVDGMSPSMIESVIDAARDDADRRIAEARETFESCCTAAAGVRAGWHQRIGPATMAAIERGRLCDVIVAAHPATCSDAGGALAVESLLFDTGRPILLIGHAPLDLDQLEAMVAWNGGRECALAATAALPLLRKAQHVRVVSVARAVDDGGDVNAVAAYLTRHGVEARGVSVDAAGRPVADILIEQAAASGLLVMGAYGHSRLREMVLGGVTRRVLAEARNPVLMVH